MPLLILAGALKAVEAIQQGVNFLTTVNKSKV